ncbi:MAG: ParB N-terminal domain-containing protein [Pirellulales bacterium]
MDNAFDIVPFSQRRYEHIPIAKIKVINARNRDQEQFDMNVTSIDRVGLIKPVRVNDKFLDRADTYELICGEGRLMAHQRLLEEMQLRHQRGLPLSQTWRDDASLLRAAAYRFGNWYAALRAAGLEFACQRSWSPALVLDGLRACYRNKQYYIREADPTLGLMARHYFGSLKNALEAAGLPPRPGRWTKQRVIDTIQDRYVRGIPKGSLGFKGKPLAEAATRYFGSWWAAVTAAGLSDRVRQPRAPQRWSRQLVIDAIQNWHRQGVPLASLHKRDVSLYGAVKRLFGSWGSAVLAAGLHPGTHALTRHYVIQEIRSRHRQSLTLDSGVAARDNPTLAEAAKRRFGNWRIAVKAAGIGLGDSGCSRRPTKKRRSA